MVEWIGMSAEKANTSPKPAKKKAKARPTPHLERDMVLDATLELLNEVGFEGLTLRRVADKLGVKAAALYWHFENKQDLINHLAARIFTREFEVVTAADLDAQSWREILAGMGRGLCSALHSYRDGATVLARADLSQIDNSYAGRRLVIAALLRKGIPEDIIFTAMFSIVRYVLGYVFEEQADPQAKRKGDTYMRHTAPALEEEFPKPTAKLVAMYKAFAEDSRPQFEQGLELILDGIQKKLAIS